MNISLIKTFEEQKQICNLYDIGISTENLALQFNCSSHHIVKILRAYKINIKSQGRPKIYQCNENYFHTIDNEQKAYWLGFIAADGSINENRLHLNLSAIDKNHLEKFIIHIQSTHPIRNYKIKNYDCIAFSIRSYQIISDLKNFGIIPNKTFTIKFPKINKKFISHFIRGYMDGDGGFYVYDKYPNQPVFSITSNRIILEKIQTHLINNCNLNKTKLSKKPNHQIARLQYSGRQVLKIFNYLYKDATIYLERKKEKIEKYQFDLIPNPSAPCDV